MTATINASTSSGLITTADTSGVLQFQSNGTAAAGVSSSNFQMNSGYGSVATAYGCRAWVNFNGTGTPAIRASGNVTSITDNGTGDYTINFTAALPDANYSAVGTARQQSAWSTGNANLTVIMASSAVATAQTTSTCRIWVQAGPGGLYDTDTVCLSIFR